MGSLNQGRSHSIGGILAGILEGNLRTSKREDGESGVTVPKEYTAEAFIYPVISKGYVTFQGLCDGSVTMKTFLQARKLSEFDEWLKNQKPKQPKEDVEYFD